MKESLCFVLFFSLINVAFHILANKWGVVNWYQLNRRRWMPDRCNFCFFFWLALIEWLSIEIVPANGFRLLDSIITPFFFALITAALSLHFKPKPECN
jgi:hypothetical protein